MLSIWIGDAKKNKPSGLHLYNWLEATGNELIVPNKATSKRSESVIDFGITHLAIEENSHFIC